MFPLYAYEFDDQTAPFYFPRYAWLCLIGLSHIRYPISLPLWHGGSTGISHPLNRKQEQLSDELVAAWTNFAWTGNPNGVGNRPWPRYLLQGNKSNWLSENIPALSLIPDTQFYSEHKCSFWDTILNY